jgi:hypothetical protein
VKKPQKKITNRSEGEILLARRQVVGQRKGTQMVKSAKAASGRSLGLRPRM